MNDSPWIQTWLDAQRTWLAQWQASSATQQADAARADMDALRETLGKQAMSASAMNIAHSFQELLQAGMMSANGSFGAATKAGSDAAGGALHTMVQAPALGPLREQQLAWQRLLRAQLEFQMCAQPLLAWYAQVLAESLSAVSAEVTQRQAQQQPVPDARALHDLWVECGEVVFARVAHDPTYIQIQAKCINATSELKLAQAVLVEQWLQFHDLPTRSEVNTLNRRVQDLQSRLAALESKPHD